MNKQSLIRSVDNPILDHDWIAARIPHQGSMCLLDRVQEWDEKLVRCVANNHRDPANPLRSHGQLASVCGIEYAAQAMAVHSALIMEQKAEKNAGQLQRPVVGYLASVRGTTLFVGRLDDIAAELQIEARHFSSDGANVLYEFLVHADGRRLLEGRAAVITNAGL